MVLGPLLLLLLLFQELVKALALFSGQDFAKLAFGTFQFFAQKGGHDFPSALLTLADNPIEFLVLLRCEPELAAGTPEELEADAARGLGEVRAADDGVTRRARDPDMLGMANEQAASDHPRTEDDHCGEDDFPGVHQPESAG